MTEEDKKRILVGCLKKFGVEKNIHSFMEEIGELLTAVNHRFRERNTKHDLIVEIVDARMMIDMLCIIFEVTPEEVAAVEEIQYTRCEVKEK